MATSPPLLSTAPSLSRVRATTFGPMACSARSVAHRFPAGDHLPLQQGGRHHVHAWATAHSSLRRASSSAAGSAGCWVERNQHPGRVRQLHQPLAGAAHLGGELQQHAGKVHRVGRPDVPSSRSSARSRLPTEFLR